MTNHTETSVDWVALLQQRAPRPLTIDDLARLGGLQHFDRRVLRKILEDHVTTGQLRRIGKTRYQWRRPEAPQPISKTPGARESRSRRGTSELVGRYTRVRAGFGFVAPDGGPPGRSLRDVLIRAGDEGSALDGDRVRIALTAKRMGARRTGRVTGIVERARTSLVGTLQAGRNGWFFRPDAESIPTLRIEGPVDRQAAAAEYAVRAVIRENESGEPPSVEIRETLGSSNDPEVQFLSIASEFGIAVDFPEPVRREAEGFQSDPVDADREGRVDLRDRPFVTIDGETARDFDDAVHVEPLDGGKIRLFVAVADVSHYVRPGTALDAEAAQRGNSVYFPDRAVPMLPHELSSGLCSLLPQRDRLVWVAEMDFDRSFRRTRAEVYRATIRSAARLTYTEVARWLAAEAEPPGFFKESLTAMHGLMHGLYRKRVRAGSLDLDLPEAVIDLAPDGHCSGVRRLDRTDAHRLIEEFMLAANQAVAVHLSDRGAALPYRVHEPPNPDSIDELNRLLAGFGCTIDFERQVEPKDVQRALREIAHQPAARVLYRQVLRALTKAHYSASNAGHFGLAFANYCHFTSPIRRYPDLLVHRQLAALSDGNPPMATEAVEEASRHCSETERTAMTAERAMADLRRAEFMESRILDEFEATVVSVAEFGVFVELEEFPVEGLVRTESLAGEYYRFDDRAQALVGVRNGRRIRLGMPVRVQCIGASPRRRLVEFRIVEFSGGDEPKSPRGKRHVPDERKRRRKKARSTWRA